MVGICRARVHYFFLIVSHAFGILMIGGCDWRGAKLGYVLLVDRRGLGRFCGKMCNWL